MPGYRLAYALGLGFHTQTEGIPELQGSCKESDAMAMLSTEPLSARIAALNACVIDLHAT